jgi:hypothetical protein
VHAFPKLTLDPNDPISQPDDYNCIAYAAGDTTKWWDNVRKPIMVQEWSIDGLKRAFAPLGYKPCADAKLEEGFEKVVFYIKQATGKPTHGARQLPDGRWTSKCGGAEDIIHQTPECLSGDLYGLPFQYMKRAIKKPATDKKQKRSA